MPRFATLVLVLVLALGALTACTGDTPGPATASSTAADETRTVCAEAISEGAAAAAEFKAKLAEGVAAVRAGDQARATQLENEMHERVAAWAAKLTELSSKHIAPAVKDALTEAAETLNTLNSEQDETPVDQVEAKFTEFAAQLAAACA